MTPPARFFCRDCGHPIDDGHVVTIAGGRDFDDAFTHTARKWVAADSYAPVQHVVLRRKQVPA